MAQVSQDAYDRLAAMASAAHSDADQARSMRQNRQEAVDADLASRATTEESPQPDPGLVSERDWWGVQAVTNDLLARSYDNVLAEAQVVVFPG